MPLTLTWQERRELYQMLRPYLKNEKVQQMNTYIQHGSVSTLQHCKYVAEVSCWLNRRLHIGANPHALLVGALLHDFYLYYMMRFGYTPSKIYRLACYTFKGAYDQDTIYKWLRTFYWRFFSQQFKRSCLPDGPKVGSVALSPRGDWRMPSDASVAMWMKDLDQINK